MFIQSSQHWRWASHEMHGTDHAEDEQNYEVVECKLWTNSKQESHYRKMSINQYAVKDSPQ